MNTDRKIFILVLIGALLIVGLNWLIISAVSDAQDTICRGGYIHNSHSGQQILNEVGGGIPCIKMENSNEK